MKKYVFKKKRERQEEVEAKRAADGHVWAEQIGTQAATLTAAQARLGLRMDLPPIQKRRAVSSAIQKRLARMRRTAQTMSLASNASKVCTGGVHRHADLWGCKNTSRRSLRRYCGAYVAARLDARVANERKKEIQQRA